MSFGSDLKMSGKLAEFGTACGRGMRDHLADYENGGTVADLLHETGQFVEPANKTSRIGARHARKYADGGLRRASRLEKTGTDRTCRRHAHIDHDRHLLVRQR